jgi:hypothetical protein|tara:strand:+ start:341 stop:517 length:177 start_codon:yes stop_codon:yes gene_type:complete
MSTKTIKGKTPGGGTFTTKITTSPNKPLKKNTVKRILKKIIGRSEGGKVVAACYPGFK